MTYLRKIIKISAEDSPNVRLARAQQAAGMEPTGEDILPGVLSWPEYCKRRRLWDKIRQCIGLDGEFYEGAEVLLYPPDWLNRAEVLDRLLNIVLPDRKAKALGCDPAEGGDNTCWSVIDEYGLLELVSLQTTDTSMITRRTRALMTQYKLEPYQVWFDRGGGGKQHVDRMRDEGLDVNAVGFGESVTDPDSYRRFHNNLKTNVDRKDDIESRYAFTNRRSEMYGMLSQLMDVNAIAEELKGELDREVLNNAIKTKRKIGFALPPSSRGSQYAELRRQLAPIPKVYDKEGRLKLPSKDKNNKESKEVTLKELLGCSPDEADSLAIAVFGMISKPPKRMLRSA